MILSNIKGIIIPEGAVKQIADGAGRILWKGGAVDVATMAIGYTGDYTDQADVIMGDGKTYRLLTLTGSGTLTLDQSVKADVWLCAGGNGGRTGGSHGGGGGRFVQAESHLAKSTVCIVGAGANGATSLASDGVGNSTLFGSLTAEQAEGSYASANGASGGGAGGGGSASQYAKGAGDGVSARPFGDNGFDIHSAGGGGGGYRDRELDDDYSGGAGGSDGANGGSRSSSGYNGGAGGTKGGGAGGNGSTSGAGANATYYGSGGGGGGYYCTTSGSVTKSKGGAGYQGVIYVRIPYEQ